MEREGCVVSTGSDCSLSPKDVMELKHLKMSNLHP
jgi:hypothetical protein